MDLKKLAGGISTSFNRAVQYTEEKLGQADRTEYDPEFESLLHLADQSEKCTERMVKATEAVMQPNPAHRVEDMVCNKLDAGRRERVMPLEELGNAMISAGKEIAALQESQEALERETSALLLEDGGSAASALRPRSPTFDYAEALTLTGEAELRLSQLEREFASACGRVFVRPLRDHLDGDARALARERRALENFRLDLDSARTRLRRSREEAGRLAAESECNKMEAEFEHQLQVTRLMLESIVATHDHHLNCLVDLIDAQSQYHSDCATKLQELTKQLGSYTNC